MASKSHSDRIRCILFKMMLAVLAPSNDGDGCASEGRLSGSLSKDCRSQRKPPRRIRCETASCAF
jgi:hypothetical protein